MEKMKINRIGQLRYESTHLRSGQKTYTDAPIDNNGKGESFSPTDLFCVSLANCMLTILEIAASQRNIEVGEISADVIKTMASNPRRVQEISITVYLENNFTVKEKQILESAAKTCPVILSMHPDVVKTLKFEYGVSPKAKL